MSFINHHFNKMEIISNHKLEFFTPTKIETSMLSWITVTPETIVPK